MKGFSRQKFFCRSINGAVQGNRLRYFSASFFKKPLNEDSPLKDLSNRGLLSFYSHEKIANSNFADDHKKNHEKTCCYTGFDPTANQQHLGNLQPLITNFRICYHYGLSPILVVGGATGGIGDPSGKSDERNLLEDAQQNDNTEKMTENLLILSKNILNFLIHNHKLYNIDNASLAKIKSDQEIIDNRTFYKDLNILTFLRDIGKFFRVGALLAKDSVSNRMAKEDGISYTEFSYQLLQAYDFKTLYQDKNCILQVGGIDQWGNISTGIDFIRKTLKKESYGLTIPLMTNEQGLKFGKSENNAIWVNEETDSLLAIHQYLINFSDFQVAFLLKSFTFLSMDQIKQIMEEHESNPEKRHAHRVLIEELIGMITGSRSEAAKYLKYSEYFSINPQEFLSTQKDQDLKNYFREMLNYKEDYSTSENMVEIIQDLCNKSKNEIRKLIKGNAIQINGNKANIEHLDIQSYSIQNNNKFYIIRIGKRTYHTICYK